MATAVDAAFADSAAAFRRLTVHAEQAHDLAVRARVLDAAEPAAPGTGRGASFRSLGLPPPAAAGAQLTGAALDEADAASRAAHAAADAVLAFPLPPAGSVDFAGLAGMGGGDQPLPRSRWLSPAGIPSRVATWWSGLSEAVQLVTIRAHPGELGRLDGDPGLGPGPGQPPRAADGRCRRSGTSPAEAALARDRRGPHRRRRRRSGQRVQLQELDLRGDLVVLALGDLDTAAAVAVLVPGIRTTPETTSGTWSTTPGTSPRAARVATPDFAVAGVVWLGLPDARVRRVPLSRDAAVRGGRQLDASLRRAGGGPAPRADTISSAHHRGRALLRHGGRRARPPRGPGGSPPMPSSSWAARACAAMPRALEVAGGLRRRHARSTRSPSRLVRHVDRGGPATERPSCPSTGSRATPDYFDVGRPTLPAIGAVVAGTENAALTRWR